VKTYRIFTLIAIVALVMGSAAPGLAGSPALPAAQAAGGNTQAPQAISLISNYVATPPTIDGQVGFNEWNMSVQAPFSHGFMSVENDAVRLYVLLDVTGDSTYEPDKDYFWLTVDVNRNSAIDANTDLNYGLYPGTQNLRYQYYLAPNQWTGLQPKTYSSRAQGFGCFWSDGTFQLSSFFPLRFTCKRHTVWELALDLAEIGATPGSHVKLGLRVASSTPAFVDDTPTNFSADFSNLIDVKLAPPPFYTLAPFPGASVGFEKQPIEITQAVQDRNNSLPLVEGKSTVARVYVFTANVFFPQMIKTYLYGSSGGVDLPGSPMVVYKSAPTVINRNSLNSTANFQLPNTWTTGSVTFASTAIDQLNHVATTAPQPLAFTPRGVPTYWVVPVNTGTNQNPVVASNRDIAAQESYLKAIYPVRDVTFVQKPWTVIGPSSVNNAISDLNKYYNSVLIAWFITVLFTGNQPFVLPDQIYGFTPSGGGLSDPVWAGGAGRVARGFLGTSMEGTMAHEINHNLDRSAGGTWGRHTPFGCGASGPDPSWPYSNSNINEVGFDTRQPWSSGGSQLTVVPSSDPDIMSYCQSGHLPTKWISPYRWQNLFGAFTSSVNAHTLQQVSQVENVYYVSGQVNRDGSGSLNPVLFQPGLPSQGVPDGKYSIQLLDANDQVIASQPFNINFPDDPEEPVDSIYFNFQIAPPVIPGQAPLAGMKVKLALGGNTLDEIQQSPNAPTISITAPAGGENWSGVQTLKWDASDPDGDPLSYTVLYSQDNGTTWNPVSSGITDTQLDVDLDQLPGGNQAIFRVIASDGFNNSQADSNPITVGNHPPQVSILTPGNGAVVKPGDQTMLSGDAQDLEDGSLPDSAFVWSDGNTVLGTGRNVSAQLPAGKHTLMLSVGDSSGNTAQASVEVNVAYQVNLPLIMVK
jgi:hypothetical protein